MVKNYWFDLCFDMMLDYIPEDFTTPEITEKFRSVITHIDVIGDCFNTAESDFTDDVAKYFSLAGIGHKEISNYETALNYYFKSVSIRTKNNNEKPLGLVYNNIAIVYNIKAEREKAIEYYQKSMEISHKFNEPPMNLAITYNNLANVYLSCYCYDDAIKWNSKALELVKNESLAENPLSVDILFTQSSICYVNENFDEALNLDFQALELLRKYFQEEHSDIGSAYNCIAREYFSMKKYSVALDYYLKAHKIYEKVYGEEDSDTAEVCGSIARTYMLLDEYNLALEWCSKALQTQKNILGDEHPEVMLRYSFISDIYEKLEMFDEAISHLIILNFFIKENFIEALKDLYDRIADNYEKINNFSEAEKYRKMGVEVKKSE
jgi:tetratricopeptide (TPR) repeat protein